MRSMTNSLFSAGNLAFRRDLMNQGEQAVSFVMSEFGTAGALSTSAVTNNDLQSANYKASTLATNPQGVPTALLSLAAFLAMGSTANDITGATSDVQIRYVIDRLCTNSGLSSSATCVQSIAAPLGTNTRDHVPSPPTATVYRLSVRVSGARSTQVFLQTTFTRPD